MSGRYSRLGLAFGGAIDYAGGWLFDAGKAFRHPELSWMMLEVIGLITSLALLWQFAPRRCSNPAPNLHRASLASTLVSDG